MLPRVLVLLLLVMNVAVASWWALRPLPPPLPPPASSEADIPPLRLLSESDPALVDADAGAEAAALSALDLGPPVADRQCLQLGPFLTQIDLRRAMNALAPLASRIQFRETREVIRRGFRVFVPSPGSREAALALARRLSRRGITDYYVVTAGDEQNTIALGLFREEANAQTRRQQVLELGFGAEIEPRNEELPQFWIDIDLPIDSDWRAELGGYAGVGSQAIACPPPPGG